LTRDVTKRLPTDLDRAVFEKQKLFIRTIKCSPGLGKHVRELHWTVLDASGQYWGQVVDGPYADDKDKDIEDGNNDTSNEKGVYAPEDGTEPVYSKIEIP
jgi:hypothetical protein